MEKFKLVTIQGGKHSVAGFGIIDFDNLNDADAEKLFKAGCPYLDPIGNSRSAEELKTDQPRSARNTKAE